MPDDFRVDEILSPELGRTLAPSGGRYALYRLVKRGIGTEEAIALIAAALDISRRNIGFGGLKDRHAVTSQHLTIDTSRGAIAALPDRWEARGVSIERLGTLTGPLAAAATSGNRFLITVRGLTRRDCRAMDEKRRSLSAPLGRGRELGFVNYYGEQRFGSAARGRCFPGRLLIEGDFEGALRLIMATPRRKAAPSRNRVARLIALRWGDWKGLRSVLPAVPERRAVEKLDETNGDYRAGFLALAPFMKQIVIEAYQSFLWNEIARRFIRASCPGPFVEAPGACGPLVFPHTGGVPEHIRAIVIPLPSPAARLAEPWRESAEYVLADEGITLGDLRIPGLRSPYFGAIPRPLFVVASRFSIGPPERDEKSSADARFKRRLRFALPRGAYATVLLDALGARAQNDFK